MNSNDELKNIVRDKYKDIVITAEQKSCCCGTKTKNLDYAMLQDDYSHLDGYVKDADLGLGCGIPTEFANIQKGETVLDLGSGAGNDVFVARHFTGPEGRVIGLDFTQEMIDKANRNKEKLGFENVEFRLGDIEDMPLDDGAIDLVISNCVLNLAPDKEKAFTEIARVVKPGGRFCVSDIVLRGELPEGFKKSAEMYAGCVAGAVQQEEYLALLERSGFGDVKVVKSTETPPPQEVMDKYLTAEEQAQFAEGRIGIFSVTVTGIRQ